MRNAAFDKLRRGKVGMAEHSTERLEHEGKARIEGEKIRK
jgi:hypothetical protein